MSTIGSIILRTYIAAIVAAAVLGPLVLLHAYRQWWADLFYAAFAFGVIGGSISHYRITRRNRTSRRAQVSAVITTPLQGVPDVADEDILFPS